jgi:uncharacterized membrane protein
MALKDTDISKGRTILLGIMGLSCLVYAILAIAQNDPQPIWWFIPMTAGLLASVGIAIAFLLGDSSARQMAHDEMYDALNHRARRHAYWIAVLMYPIFAVIIMTTGLSWETTFAAMGTLTSAAYLLLLTLYEWRMS